MIVLTRRSSGALRSSDSEVVGSQSTLNSDAISFMSFNFTSPEGGLIDNFSITCNNEAEFSDAHKNIFGCESEIIKKFVSRKSF